MMYVMKYLLRFFLVLSFLLGLKTAALADVYTASRACVRVTCSDGVGSGIVVGADAKYYYAITNAHVATKEKAVVEFFDAGKITRADAVLVQRDAALDLAVYKIDTKGYNPAIIPLDPNFSMQEGDVLCTIGHPLGKYPTCFFCTYKKDDPAFGLMFTPPPAQGRSGSPLLAPDGSRVVGIVYGYTTQDMIGLAIPARVVASFLSGAVGGTPHKTKWTPPRDGVVRFTAAKRSILVNPPEDEEEEYTPILPEADPEAEPEYVDEPELQPMTYTGTLFFMPERREQPDRLPGWRLREMMTPQDPQRPFLPPPRPLFWRQRQPIPQPQEYPTETPQRMEPTGSELTGLKIQIGDVEFQLKDPKPAPQPPAPPAPTPAPKPKPKPPKPHHPAPPHHPHPAPPPRPLPPPRPSLPPSPVPPGVPPYPGPAAPASLPFPNVGDLAATGAVVLTKAEPDAKAEPDPAPVVEEVKPTPEGTVILTQYIYPTYPQSSCPGGNCPLQPQATIPQVVTPAQPVPAQIVGQDPKPAEKKEEAPAPKAAPVPAKEAPDVMCTQFLRSMDSCNGRIQTLEGRVSRLESESESLRRDVEKLSNSGQSEDTESTGFFTRPVPQAIENGLTGAGRAIGEAVTLEVGEDVKTTLATVNTSVEASTEALTQAAESFTGTMAVTQETLAAIQRCTDAIYILLAVLIGTICACLLYRVVCRYTLDKIKKI